MRHAAVFLIWIGSVLCACSSTPAGPSVGEADPADPQPDQRSPADPRASSPLEGRAWRLVEIAGRPAVTGLGDRVASVTFAGGSVHGSSGLNTIFGPYAIDGASLRVERLGATKMAGPPESMQQESAFVAALQGARAWVVRGDELELLDESSVVLARLRAR